jgi:GxxExxY protein
MPYENEEPPFWEPSVELNPLTEKIIGAAMEVHKKLGPGLDESLYEAAMCIELELRGIGFQRQVQIDVEYKGVKIGNKRIDLIVEGKVLVELKAVEQLAPVHKAQVLTYLKLTGLKLGLLINFNVPVLKEGIKRIINP